MKSRDASAMLVDHRRQALAPPPPAPSRGDDARKKKQQKPKQQPKSATGNTSNNAVATAATVVAPAPKKAADSGAMKKNPAKLSKAAKKKAAAAAAVATSEKDTAVKAMAATTLSKQQHQQRILDPDSHKSRNHTLFLAPSGLSAPSWGRNRKEATALSVAERLHAEILEYAQYTRSTVEAMAVHIEVMIANVRACVQSLWPRSTVETFGSYSTGIWLPSSDVDLVILDVVEANDAVATGKNLRRLAKALKSQPWVHSLLVLDSAKIPVLKLVSADTRVPIDITFESSTTHSGLIARDLIKRYNEELPELYPLAVVFKQLLRERDLNDAYTGGLSSYSIVLMIVHFSQLWRNGERCFHAAAIYASGSLPPAPAAMAADVARAAASTKSGPSRADATGATPTEVGSPVKLPLPLPPTSSYAAIVTRSKASSASLASEADGKATSNSHTKASTETASVQRFSYAAVAAGIVKVSAEDDNKSKPSAPAPPSSYAAAVAAAAGSKSSAAVVRCAASAKPSSASSSSPAAPSTPTGDAQLDSHTMLLLEYFGIIFDYRKNGISIRDGGYIYRLAEHGAAGVGKPALVIEDPIHPDRNVSASSFAFPKVVAVFEDAFYALKYYRPSKFAPSALSCLLSSSGHSSHASKCSAASSTR
ncbi:hypothetical protein PybrP1_007862 [[Pythium] brassicae (nom. inval.)]|nr:hypothetical protein PybrP1_007862 [[Pythium] brassicae (nom. inval.)]